jgi:uncharacterized FAD-dependent dehydrogenase
MIIRNENYDVAIVGGGISGLMCAYRLVEKHPELKIVLVERGSSLEKRKCPILDKKVQSCIKCKNCAIMEGMAGAGAFSDGKYVISTEYGGWLTELMPDETVIGYIEQADSILVSFGAPTERFMPDNELKRLALKYDLHMSQAQLKHFGTDGNLQIMGRLIKYLSEHITIYTETAVTDIDRSAHRLKCSTRDGRLDITAERIILALGRAGSRFFYKWCHDNNIPVENNQVDVGVRVELPAIVWDEFSKRIYEPKIK